MEKLRYKIVVIINSTIEQKQEELDKQYPLTGIYEDTKESYNLEHVKGSIPNGKVRGKSS